MITDLVAFLSVFGELQLLFVALEKPYDTSQSNSKRCRLLRMDEQQLLRLTDTGARFCDNLEREPLNRYTAVGGEPDHEAR